MYNYLWIIYEISTLDDKYMLLCLKVDPLDQVVEDQILKILSIENQYLVFNISAMKVANAKKLFQ